MPYELLAKVGAGGALIIFLGFLLYSYVGSTNREHESYKKLVDDVRKESNKREEKLMAQIDKCTNSLQQNTESLKEISKNMQAIPVMQADISYLKERVK